MHRALVIRLGESLEGAVEHLRRECTVRSELGRLDEVQVRFLDAPPAAVGNLSNPVQILRENLEADLLAELTDLLRLAAGAADFVLDVFVLVNLGEPLVANATTIVIDMMTDIVATHFRAMFPAHRTGSQRRFRVVPIAMLPAASDCAKDRSDAVAELEALHDAFASRRQRATSATEYPVDRLFLVDAMTGRGIATLDDLVAQLRGFLRLTLFSGIRRDADFVQLLEGDCNDLFGTFGVATCEVDIEEIRATLTARMTEGATKALGEAGATALPDTGELLPLAVMDDASLRKTVVAELDALPLRTLDVEGSEAVRPLRMLYSETARRLELWREQAAQETATPPASTEVAASPLQSSGVGWKFAAATALGGAVGLMAHFGLAVAVNLSIATGGGFAAVAFLVLLAFLRESDGAPTPRPAGPGDPGSAEVDVLDELTQTIERRLGQLVALDETFGRMAEAIDVDESEDDAPAPAVRSPFGDTMTTDSLLDLLYTQRASDETPRALVDSFLSTVGSWNDLLSGSVTVDVLDLAMFCREHFRALGGDPIFANGDNRACVRPALARFVATWRSSGVPVFLEGESRKQFDPDGFRTPFRSCVVAPPELAALLRDEIGESTLTLYRGTSRLDDVFVFGAVFDIHPDAVSALER